MNNSRGQHGSYSYTIVYNRWDFIKLRSNEPSKNHFISDLKSDYCQFFSNQIIISENAKMRKEIKIKLSFLLKGRARNVGIILNGKFFDYYVSLMICAWRGWKFEKFPHFLNEKKLFLLFSLFNLWCLRKYDGKYIQKWNDEDDDDDRETL